MQIINKNKTATADEVCNGIHYGLTIVSIIFAAAFTWCIYADALGFGGF
jgi:hypothetical protein